MLRVAGCLAAALVAAAVAVWWSQAEGSPGPVPHAAGAESGWQSADPLPAPPRSR